MKEKVLIIGGSGLLGVNWAIQKRNSHDMIIGLNQRNIKINNVSSLSLDTSHYLAVSNWMNIIRPNIVVNAAGLTSVESCETNPDLAEKINVILTQNLAIASAAVGAKMVQISTDHLFSGDFPTVSEKAEPKPINQYGLTKLKAEKAVFEACENSLIIRTNFYGWGTSYRNSFTDFIISNLRNGNPIKLFNDVFYSPILISVLVDTIHELIEKDAKGIFNIVGDERISKYSFGKKVADIFSLDDTLILSDFFSNRKDLVKRPLDMSLSNKKVVNFLGRTLGDVKDHLWQLKEQETQYYQEIIQL